MNKQRSGHESNVLETWRRHGFVPPTETRPDFIQRAARVVPALQSQVQPRAAMPSNKE